MRRTSFKRRDLSQDFLCRRDYAERVVTNFGNQIQSEYYGGNRSLSIEGIVLEYFSAVPQANINSYTLSRPWHGVFNYFILQQQTGCCHYYCTQQTIDFIAQGKKN